MERRVKGGIVTVIGVIIVLIILLYPYLPHSSMENLDNHAKIIISENFGERCVKTIEVKPGESVIKTLEDNFNITTAYGGKFVTSIDGINQNATHFWFYYVNGILANVGAADYIIHAGDVIRWDFHVWKRNEVIYAEIEDFPEPLLHGYGGRVYNTTIVYSADYEKYAMELKNYLTKMGVNVSVGSNVSKYENVIILGYPKQANWINEKYRKFGWIYHVQDSLIIGPNGRYSGAFAQITQSPFNPKGLGASENVIIWIYATDGPYMQRAINDLENGKIGSFWYFTGEGE